MNPELCRPVFDSAIEGGGIGAAGWACIALILFGALGLAGCGRFSSNWPRAIAAGLLAVGIAWPAVTVFAEKYEQGGSVARQSAVVRRAGYGNDAHVNPKDGTFLGSDASGAPVYGKIESIGNGHSVVSPVDVNCGVSEP